MSVVRVALIKAGGMQGIVWARLANTLTGSVARVDKSDQRCAIGVQSMLARVGLAKKHWPHENNQTTYASSLP